VPRLQVVGAHAKEKFRNSQIECENYAHEHGVDRPEAANWVWPY
jgi:xylulose-5-phosphate/fructose-6-phosphate phosphoketolase